VLQKSRRLRIRAVRLCRTEHLRLLCRLSGRFCGPLCEQVQGLVGELWSDWRRLGALFALALAAFVGVLFSHDLVRMMMMMIMMMILMMMMYHG
jgi:hypothetical protein